MLDKWFALSKSNKIEIEVSEWFQNLTEDIVTRTAFGRSYEDGKAIFQLQAQQMVLASEAFQKVSILSYSLEKGVELDCHWIEFDDVRYHIQASMKNPNLLFLSLSLPTPPPQAVSFGGLPLGAIEAIKAAYGVVAQILDPPQDGFSLTVKLNLSKLPLDEGSTSSF